MLLKNKKVVFVAMSGGVDSSVSALILKQMGFDVVGVTFLLYESKVKGEGRTCCSAYDISDAERVAMKIKIPFYVMDMREEFRKFIIENFISEYKAGRTPIPCVHCNDIIKFKIFFEKAKKLGADFIATGHYALKRQENGYAYISKAYDRKKDQSYFLFGLKSEQLKNILFPVGGMTKDYVRKVAYDFDLPTAKKPESQDICFTEGKDWREKIKEFGVQEKKGEIVDIESGKVVGEHNGYFFFTIGQRRGLNVALGRPVYVVKLDPEKNRVFVGNKENLLVRKFFVENLSFPNEEIEQKLENEGMECVVKVRYTHEGTEAFVRKQDGKLLIIFKERFGPVVPGQACVLYKHDKVLGGGFISHVEYEW
jgi:tRNA-specific 2-thiouridylase